MALPQRGGGVCGRRYDWTRGALPQRLNDCVQHRSCSTGPTWPAVCQPRATPWVWGATQTTAVLCHGPVTSRQRVGTCGRAGRVDAWGVAAAVKRSRPTWFLFDRPNVAGGMPAQGDALGLGSNTNDGGPAPRFRHVTATRWVWTRGALPPRLNDRALHGSCSTGPTWPAVCQPRATPWGWGATQTTA